MQSIFIWVCFDLVYIYECIDISTVFKKKYYDLTLYTSKEIDWPLQKKIDWFVIQDKLNFFLMVENFVFYHSFLTITIGKLKSLLYSITSKLAHNMNR